MIELTGILDKIGNELTNLISLAKNDDYQIDIEKLAQQSNILNNLLITSEIPEEEKLMLKQFSLTLVQGNPSLRSLRYEKQDLERVLSNLNDL